jgi:glycosyltransferase involved in cell wall biosynthesis
LFCTSSIYIASSIYEPFGLAPLEAAACGCAIVARDLPSLREIWGDSALYFTNSTALQHALESLAESPEILQAAQQRALTRAESFTACRMADEYIETYQQIIGEKKIDKDVKIDAA